MINPERHRAYVEWQNSRNALQKVGQAASDFITRARESLDARRAVVIYGIPIRQDRLTRYFTPEFFSYIHNPLSLDLYSIAQNLVEEGKKAGNTVYDREKDSHIREHGKVVIRTDHAMDFAKPGFLDYDERAIVITGSDAMVSSVLGATDSFGEAFTSFHYEDQPIDLFKDGSRRDLPDIFSEIPNPIPAGSVIRFSNLRYNLEAKILPIPQGLPTPQVALLGPSEKNNLDSVFHEAQTKGGRILVAFKQGHEGLAQGFTQHRPGFDVYEFEDADKKRVRRKNGKRTRSHSLPKAVPGTPQVVLIPVKGNIESLVREWTVGIRAGIPPVSKAVGVFGIDIIETGSSASKPAASLVPIDFRTDGSRHTPGGSILRMYNRMPDRYLEYVRRNAIMPVQPIAVTIKRRGR